MTRRLALCLPFLLILAACGVDGAPQAPEPAPEPGITMSGEAQIGVVVGNP